jgi:hypothetical protein
MSFEVRKPMPVEISSRAMVRIEGDWYSVPSRWARLASDGDAAKKLSHLPL